MHAIATFKALSRVYVQFAWQLECLIYGGCLHREHSKHSKRKYTETKQALQMHSHHCKQASASSNMKTV